MIALEIVCGFAVLDWLFSFRFFATIMLLLNLFFLFITGYALFTGKVKECGCFGTCVKKYLIMLLSLKILCLRWYLVILFIYRNRVTGMFHSKAVNAAIRLLAILFASGNRVVHAYPPSYL